MATTTRENSTSEKILNLSESLGHLSQAINRYNRSIAPFIGEDQNQLAVLGHIKVVRKNLKTCKGEISQALIKRISEDLDNLKKQVDARVQATPIKDDNITELRTALKKAGLAAFSADEPFVADVTTLPVPGPPGAANAARNHIL